MAKLANSDRSKEARYRERNRNSLNAKQRARRAAMTPAEKASSAARCLEWQKTPQGRESKNRSRRKQWETPQGRAYALWRVAKASANKRGLEIDITPEFIRELISAGECSVTGIPFVFERRHTEGEKPQRHPFGPSIDRKDPTKGYVRDNVQLVVWIYNAAKSNWSHGHVLQLAEALVSREGQRQVDVFGMQATLLVEGPLACC